MNVDAASSHLEMRGKNADPSLVQREASRFLSIHQQQRELRRRVLSGLNVGVPPRRCLHQIEREEARKQGSIHVESDAIDQHLESLFTQQSYGRSEAGGRVRRNAPS